MTQPDGADTLAQLRQRIADAIRGAAHDCDSDTGPEAGACQAQHPIQIGAWHHDVVSDVYGPVDAITAVVLAVVQPEMERLRDEVQVQVDRKMEIAGEWLNDRTDKVAAEKALAEAQADVKRLGAQYTEAMSGARELSEKLREARTTNERLNYRAQTAESRLNTVTVAVANWQVGENGNYVPLHTLAAIAKAVGFHHDTSRWEIHHERIEALEAALARVREYATAWAALQPADLVLADAGRCLLAVTQPPPPTPVASPASD